ncbi:aminotransferase class III-fold pyridoxal phosphate-dependent enzyme [Streptomyces prunicolor]|uniref:aminotransferase class III-fold pyridoxal phosphate-dependent enzyme n=1 Tax=Streptomyces prunicolor TaxID=67348 RepID=UPI00370FF172
MRGAPRPWRRETSTRPWTAGGTRTVANSASAYGRWGFAGCGVSGLGGVSAVVRVVPEGYEGKLWRRSAREGRQGNRRCRSVREPAARTYARALPTVSARTRGPTVEGTDGRRFLDCVSGAGTAPLGHNHRMVLEAICNVLDSGAPLRGLNLATPVRDAFVVAELFRALPSELADHARVRVCGPTDTDTGVVGAAFRILRGATGRAGVHAFAGTHHGMSVGGAGEPERGLDGPDSGVPNLAGISSNPSRPTAVQATTPEDGAPPDANSADLQHELRNAQAQRPPEHRDSTPHASHSETPPEEQP